MRPPDFRRAEEPPAWREMRVRAVAVKASAGSYAARLVPTVLRQADQLASALTRLAGPANDRGAMPIEIVLTDPAAATESQSPPPLNGQAPAAATEGPIPVSVQPDAGNGPLAVPLARRLLGRWYGPRVAEDPLLVEGLAGMASARTRTGPSVDECDQWVRKELDAGRRVPVLPSGRGGAPPDSRAATSFLAFVAAGWGAGALREFLTRYDPDRRDTAAIAAFRQPLSVLEESWRTGTRRGGREPGSLLPRLLPLLRPYRWKRVEILVLLVAAAALNLVPAIAGGWIIDRLRLFFSRLPPPSPGRGYGPDVEGFVHGTLVPFVLFLLTYYVVDSLVSLRRAAAVGNLNQRILSMLQEKMFSHMQRLGHDFYAHAKLGDLMARLTGDLQDVQQALSQITNKGLYQAFNFTAVLCALVWVSHKNVALIGAEMLFAPLFAVSFFALRRHNKQASKEQRKRMGEATAFVQENLAAQAVIKAYSMEAPSQASYHSLGQKQAGAALRLNFLSALTDLSEDLILGLARLLIYGVGGLLVVRNVTQDPAQGLTIGNLVVLTSLLSNLFGPIAALAAVLQNLQQASGAMDRVSEIFDEPVSITDAAEAVALAPLSQDIRLENVSFGYDVGQPILNGLDLTIPAGASVAFVGPSGCGKSTTVNLLMRFYDPDDGRVLFDGRDLRGVSLASLRGQIGLVFQDTFLFDTSVAENIRLSRPGASDEEVQAAARAACLDGFVRGLPAGYDTVLGERGARMSGGQRQRLAIARAILRNPRILILDEATSALDAQTEAAISETLAQVAKGRTTISITHRLAWAAGADLIFVLDKGRVVERGTHADLVAAGGLYQLLYEEQTSALGSGVPGGAPSDATRLRAVPLFLGLSDDNLGRIAQTMEMKWHAPGAEVVSQGETGDRLYLIGAGEAEVLSAEGGQERRVNTLGPGDYFGEMGLLTDAPRSATVRTVLPTQLYSLSRADFAALLEREPDIRRALAGTVAAQLRSVPLFAGLSDPSLFLVAKNLGMEQYAPGVEVVSQGETGDRLYLIGAGEAEVLSAEGGQERRVNTLGPGDYFGEMGLLTDAPRSATVRTVLPTQLYSLSRADFAALLEREPDIRRALAGTVAARRLALAGETASPSAR